MSKVTRINIHVLESDSDRISAIKVIKDYKCILTVIGIYLPYEAHTTEQMDLYIETLDQLQSIIDNCDPESPIAIVGDMNTTLPQSQELAPNWFRNKPFAARSGILYEFMCDNHLITANFMFKQKVNYTYTKAGAHSYIDHILVSDHLSQHIKQCLIYSDSCDNASDHLAVNIVLQIPMELRRSTDDKSIKSPQYIRGNWQNEKFCRAYQEELENQLTDVVMLDVSEVNKLNAQIKVNNMYNELCDVMHSATRKCCNQYRTIEKSHRKNWWNKDCLRARNQNRLFFYIWKSLGRPSQGEAYKCYMESRRAYRRVCRNAVNNKINNKFQLINKLYKQHNSKKLWNVIRGCKKSDTCTDAIDLNTLKDYFSNKFASASPNSFQKEADAEVTAHYERLCATPSSLIMTNYNVQKFIKLLKPGCTPGIDGITTEHLSNGLKTSLPLYLSTLFSVCLKYGIVPNDFLNVFYFMDVIQ